MILFPLKAFISLAKSKDDSATAYAYIAPSA